jgi:hypothetical protein
MITYGRRAHPIRLFLLPRPSQIQDVDRRFVSERRASQLTAPKSALGVVLEP